MHLITSSVLKECLLVHNAPINVKPVRGRQGMGWGFDCLFWPWVRAFDRSCSPGGGDIWIFLRPTWERCGIFDCRLGRKRLRLNICFPTSTLHTPNQGSQIRQIWHILRQNCSDDSTEVTEGVTSTPEICGNKQGATLTADIFVKKHSFVLTFFATNKIYVNCKRCKP